MKYAKILIFLGLAFIVLCLILALSNKEAEGAGIYYQDGVSPTAGYAGTQDGLMEQSSPASAARGDDTYIIQKASATSEARAAIRWDLLDSISASSIVNFAYIDLRIDPEYIDTIRVFGLKNSRAFTDGITDDVDYCWNKYAGGNAWTTAGCADTTTDRDGTQIAQFTIGAIAEHTKRIYITSLAQEWVDNTREENGVFFLCDEVNTGIMYIFTSEWTTAANRPKLAISYSSAGQAILFPNADLGTPQWETISPALPATHFEKVNNILIDDITYIATKTINKQDWFSLTNATDIIPDGSTIDSVKIIDRCKGETDDDFNIQEHRVYYKIGTDSTVWAPAFIETYATRTSAKLTAPGGRTWTGANLDSLVLNLRKDVAGVPADTYYTYSSWLYVSVWYSAVSTANQANAITKDIEDVQGITEGGIVR